jgi:hypothetical protein
LNKQQSECQTEFVKIAAWKVIPIPLYTFINSSFLRFPCNTIGHARKTSKLCALHVKNLKRAREPENIEMAEATASNQVELDILVCSSCN